MTENDTILREEGPDSENGAAPDPDQTPENAPRRKTRKDWRRVRALSPMTLMIPHIMVNRVGSQNFISDSTEISALERYMKEKQNEGMKNLSFMHIMIASYIRLVSQRPALNRFIRGSKIWTRSMVEISLVIKKEMTLESPDTVLKIKLPPDATLSDVYNALNDRVEGYRDKPGGNFDTAARILCVIPSIILRFVITMFRFLDYFGLLPRVLTDLSPFHASYFITSMGSLGIPPIYHHLYDFGTCPVFFAFGAKRREYELGPDGAVTKKQYVDFTYVTDERICDGYYFASALRLFKTIIRDPWQLDTPPEMIVQDVR